MTVRGVLGAGAVAFAVSCGVGSQPAAPKVRAGYSYCRFQNFKFGAPNDFFGVTAPDIQTGSDAYRACSLGRMAAYHIGYFRYDMDWAGVEIRPGVFDFSGYDALMAQLALHHISYLPILGNAPRFRTVAPHSGPLVLPGWYAPTYTKDFVRFVAAAVARYGPRGSFWREHSELPRDPIRAWQVWNEPSLYFYWEPRPNPAAYTRFLCAANKAIKRADPTARVVTAGLPWFSVGAFAKDFWAAMFRHRARGCFDALAFHSYAPSARLAIARVVKVRQLLDQAGARRAPIWITEFGWAVADTGPYTVGSRQGSVIRQFLQYVAGYRVRLRIEKVMYFNWRDPPPVAHGDWWADHMGLYRSNGTPRAAAGVVSAFAAMLNR
jgi:polysaccharide biosynthesis protein PslG